jgi:uncharacterized protein (DUF302 family)
MQKIITTKYGYSIVLPIPFDAVVTKVKKIFLGEGFGVLTEINVKEKMKEKLGKNIKNYIILGMCNPALAYQALEAEQEIGLLLPCNVIVYEDGDKIRVSAQRPKVMLQVTENDAIAEIAEEADQRIIRALATLAK